MEDRHLTPDEALSMQIALLQSGRPRPLEFDSADWTGRPYMRVIRGIHGQVWGYQVTAGDRPTKWEGY